MKPRSDIATAPVQRVTLTREEAASALGMSVDSFDRHVAPHLRIIRLGRMRLVAVAELERWATTAGEMTLRTFGGTLATTSGRAARQRPRP